MWTKCAAGGCIPIGSRNGETVGSNARTLEGVACTGETNGDIGISTETEERCPIRFAVEDR